MLGLQSLRSFMCFLRFACLRMRRSFCECQRVGEGGIVSLGLRSFLSACRGWATGFSLLVGWRSVLRRLGCWSRNWGFRMGYRFRRNGPVLLSFFVYSIFWGSNRQLSACKSQSLHSACQYQTGFGWSENSQAAKLNALSIFLLFISPNFESTTAQFWLGQQTSEMMKQSLARLSASILGFQISCLWCWQRCSPASATSPTTEPDD